MTDFIHCALPDSLSFFIYVFQKLPNRALSDEGCATTEANQLYHRLSLSETTLAAENGKRVNSLRTLVLNYRLHKTVRQLTAR
jgi:hypothetical protein